MLDLEINQTPDAERRRRVQLLASRAHHSILVRQPEIERAQQIEAWKVSAFDALHIACAESGEADVFLTTDDKLLRKSTAHVSQLRVRVENPLTRLKKVSKS